MSYPPPIPPAKGTLPYPLSMLPGPSTTSQPPSMPRAQGTLPYPLSMLPGQPDQMAPFQLPSVPAQVTVSYPPQMRPHQMAMPQKPQMLPTPFTTPSAHSQTTPQPNGPAHVWALRIPGDGSPIERVMVEIVTDHDSPTEHKPFLKRWWPEGDPTAQPMYPTLHAQFDPPPLRGYYFLFTRVDATYIPRNHYMGHRICGDAFLLKTNHRRCEPEFSPEKAKFRYAIYEDVPEELVNSDLLGEIMRPLQWKVLPHMKNIVRLGFVRAGMKHREEKERKEREKREKQQREIKQKELVQRKEEQMERDAKEWEQIASKRRLRSGMATNLDPSLEGSALLGLPYQEQKEKKQKEEQRERAMREWEKIASKSRLRSGMATNLNPSLEERDLHGLPYQLRPGMATTPNPSLEERPASTPNIGPAPHDTLMSSIEGQDESISTDQPRLFDPPNLSWEERHRFTPISQPASQGIFGSSFEQSHRFTPMNQPAPQVIFEPSFEERHGFIPMNQTTPHGMAGPSFEEGDWFTPFNENTPHGMAGPSFEEGDGFTPINETTPHGMPGSSFEECHDVTPINETAPHDLFEWPS